MRMRNFGIGNWALALVSCLALSTAPAWAAPTFYTGTPIFYTGDPNGADGLANEVNGLYTQANVYTNFTVPSSGWTVTGLFTNNAMDFAGVTNAEYSIRSGITPGNGGTIVASGDIAATQTDTNSSITLSGTTLEIYTITVSGLNVNLAPGQYWFSVAPDLTNYATDPNSSGLSFQVTTSGANSIVPGGYMSNPYFDSADLGVSFQPATSEGSDLTDFSGGIFATANGTAVPEPSSFALLLMGGSFTGLGLLGRYRRRLRKC